MHFRAVNDKTIKIFNKHRTILTISATIVFVCLISIVYSIENSNDFSLAVFLAFGTIFEIAWIIFLFQLVTVIKLKKAIAEIGRNLIVSIDESFITLEDKFKNRTITIKHSIKKLEVYPHVFSSKQFNLCNLSGLLIIADKEKFYKAMSAQHHKLLDPFDNRLAILEGGFFVACTKYDSLMIMEKLNNAS